MPVSCKQDPKSENCKVLKNVLLCRGQKTAGSSFAKLDIVAENLMETIQTLLKKAEVYDSCEATRTLRLFLQVSATDINRHR